jgi:outer membrane biosynthesis protein TonB
LSAFASIRLRKGEELRNLWIGLASSVVAHLLGFLLYLFLDHAAILLQKQFTEQLKARQLAEEKKFEEEAPLLFVEVTPEQSTPEPPKDPKFYSSANSLAANPDPKDDTSVPRIDGSQDKVPKTFDTLRPAPEPAPPTPPPEPEEPEPQPRDLTVGASDPATKPKPERPKTVAQAQMQQGIIAGPRMRQEGGVKRRGVVSLDTKATPFGAYDAAVIAAIQRRWYDLLEDSSAAPKTGKVVLEFRMHSDGGITDLKIVEEDVGEIRALYCRKAVSDPAPYAPWPSDMRRMIGKDYRDVRFTFYYL